MTLTFSIIETNMGLLWDFGWFDLTRFKIEGPVEQCQETRSVLFWLLRDSIFQRSLCSPEAWGAPGTRHGPFPTEIMQEDWYRPLVHDELLRRVASILEDPDFDEPPSGEQCGPVEAWLDGVQARGEEVLVLHEPSNPNARVHWNVWTIFQEFICISPDREELSIAIFGYD